MITSADEYFSALFKINENGNIPSLAVVLPRDEHIYRIDLDSRTVESPEFLSVLDDHESETVYFRVSRFYQDMDLSQCGCVIQYINALGDKRIYQVPFYDIETFASDHDNWEMLVPWCIEGEATKAAGDITYSIRFFKIDDITKSYVTFNLNTIPATSKIKEGIRMTDIYIKINIDRETFESNIAKGITYYIKDNEGKYQKANNYNVAETYYTIVDKYDPYESAYLNVVYQLNQLKRETQTYWYDATDRSRMDDK